MPLKIILFHNHNSGDPALSREDISITEIIKESGRILGIELIDHIIFQFYGIAEELLQSLSYESKLGKSIKNTLRKFEKDNSINEILDLKEFYESTDLLKGVKFSYRIKSLH